MHLPLRILGIPGSLRQQSYSRAVLTAAQRLVPSIASLDLFDLHDIPPYDRSSAEMPAAVLELKRRIRAADAVLFSVPEHLYSASTVVDNAIAWAAAPDHDNAWVDKPAAVVGASDGWRGTALAQHHLRCKLADLQMRPLRQVEVVVREASSAFDRRGDLVNAVTRDMLSELLADLVGLAQPSIGAHATHTPAMASG
ncbi:MAG: NAD(P)H-dependent oxidoreductase [Chitinophagaceae bacterium]|nr:NAD(P)H-dependent oxidoreductase [Rubrivivax sp.]